MEGTAKVVDKDDDDESDYHVSNGGDNDDLSSQAALESLSSEGVALAETVEVPQDKKRKKKSRKHIDDVEGGPSMNDVLLSARPYSLPDPYSALASDEPGMCHICWTRHALGACTQMRLPSVLDQAQQAILDPRNNEPVEVKVSG